MFSRRLGLGLGLRPRGAILPRRGVLRALAAPADGHVFNAGDTDGPQPMSVFGAQRVALAKEVMLVLKSMPCKPRFFLDNGTLLGLWRNGELIDSDDDFDFGLLVCCEEFSADWAAAFQSDFQGRLEQRLKDTGSDTPFRSRVVDSYAQKIEIYDPTHGSFPLDGERYAGARFHHVTVDLQIHVEELQLQLPVDGQEEVRRGVSIRHADFETRGTGPGCSYEPFGSVSFAGAEWPVPGRQDDFLSYLYGYVGTGAEFDIHSRLYRKKLVPESADADSNDGAAQEPPVVRLYTDMCADLFHTGHVNYLRQCQAVGENVHLTVGIHSDETIESYKRAVCTSPSSRSSASSPLPTDLLRRSL